MILTRFWKNGLFLIVAACLAGCLGTQPASSGGDSPANIGGDVPMGPGEKTFNGVADEAASQPKPLPGGAVATGGSWGDEDIKAFGTAFGTASRCEVVSSRGTYLKTMLNGYLGTPGKDLPVPPKDPTHVLYLRVMDLSKATPACSDLKLDADLHFEGEIQVSGPENLKLFLFSVLLFGFGNQHPACDPYDPLELPAPITPIENEIDFSALGVETTSPACPKGSSTSTRQEG